MSKKNSFFSFFIIIYIVFSLSYPKNEFSFTNSSISTRLEDSINNRILWPSMINPTTVESGDKIDVIFQSTLENNPINAVLSNNYVKYAIPIQETVLRENGEKVSVFKIPSNVMNSLYNLELVIDAEHRITSFNSINVIDNDPDRIDSYSFIHLTDTHFDGSEDRKKKMVQLINEINLIHPDFAVFTGDLVDGLVSDSEGNMITAADQFPQIVELLKGFKIPVLMVNGNHDFQTNQWQDGNALWEKYLGSLEWISRYSYRQDLYVGCSLMDENGLTEEQILGINNAFKTPSYTKVFFAHTDYQNQFSNIYEQNRVNLSLLGHEHASSSRTISGTLEVVTDNSITLIGTEPGHYRLFSVAPNKEIDSLEIEVNKLNSSTLWELKDDSTISIEIIVRNFHDFNFQNLSKEISIPGNWTSNRIVGSESHLFFNGTDTLLTTKMDVQAKTEIHYSIELTKTSSITSWNLSSFKLEQSLKESSEDRQNNRTGVSVFEIQILLIGAFILLYIQRKLKKKKGS